jgi:hypothetical protein
MYDTMIDMQYTNKMDYKKKNTRTDREDDMGGETTGHEWQEDHGIQSTAKGSTATLCTNLSD